MLAVTALLSCIIKIRGIFKSTKWRHFENVKFEPLSARRVKKPFNFNKPLVMTEVDKQCFKTLVSCHLCGEKYTDKDVWVRDHCHITGKFRGSAQQE